MVRLFCSFAGFASPFLPSSAFSSPSVAQFPLFLSLFFFSFLFAFCWFSLLLPSINLSQPLLCYPSFLRSQLSILPPFVLICFLVGVPPQEESCTAEVKLPISPFIVFWILHLVSLHLGMYIYFLGLSWFVDLRSRPSVILFPFHGSCAELPKIRGNGWI